jgi:hypothetical protein
VQGTAFAQLQGLASLKTLGVRDSQVDDEGLRSMVQLPQLQYLTVSQSQVAGKRLANVNWPLGLEMVDVSVSDFGDEGLMNLSKCKSLRTAVIVGTKVTPEGLKQFRKARPWTIVHGPDVR